MMVSGSLKEDDGDHDGEPDLAKGLWEAAKRKYLTEYTQNGPQCNNNYDLAQQINETYYSQVLGALPNGRSWCERGKLGFGLNRTG